MLRLAGLLIGLGLAAALCACQQSTPSAQAPAPVSTSTSEATGSLTPDEVSLERAISTVVERANRNDVAYFRTLVRGNDDSARFWILRVKRNDILRHWRSLVETGPTSARLVIGRPDYFMIVFDKRGDDWVARSLGAID